VNKYREAAKLEINVLQRLHEQDSHDDKSEQYFSWRSVALSNCRRSEV